MLIDCLLKIHPFALTKVRPLNKKSPKKIFGLIGLVKHLTTEIVNWETDLFVNALHNED